MVEYTFDLDAVFSSLADPTRRDILRQVSKKAMSISGIAKQYNLTFAAVSKHLMVLERAKLIVKERQGKNQLVHIAPDTLKGADDYLKAYKWLWEERLDALDQYLHSKGE